MFEPETSQNKEIKHVAHPSIQTQVIGTILVTLSFLVIPGVLLYGYYYKVLESEMNSANNTDPLHPSFNRIGKVTKNGLVLFTIWAVFSLVPGLLLFTWESMLVVLQPIHVVPYAFVLMWLLGLGLVGGFPVVFLTGELTVPAYPAISAGLSIIPAGKMIILLYYLVFLLAILYGISSYLTCIGISLYAETGKIRSAFSLNNISKRMRMQRYAVAWAKASAFSALGWSVAIIPVVISYAGILSGSKFIVLEFINPGLPLPTLNGILFFSIVLVASYINFRLLTHAFSTFGKGIAQNRRRFDDSI